MFDTYTVDVDIQNSNNHVNITGDYYNMIIYYTVGVLNVL